MCDATGSPRPKIKWFKNGQLLSPCDHIRRTGCVNNPRYIKEMNELDIKHARFPEDDGKYICVAENVLGKDKISVDVVVKGMPRQDGLIS